jgi:transcriptional regulator GlxA family with amidase domain
MRTNTVVPCPSAPVSSLEGRDIHTLVVVGGDGAIPGMRDRQLVETITTLAAGAQRVCSVCSGALVLAATGLLDGRRAVTHWDDCKMLAEVFPRVKVELDPIYIQDGPIWTSAGITSGIDMALAIVSEDLGRRAAMRVARSMVVQMARSGGQSQFSPTLGRQFRDKNGRFEALHEWIAVNLDLPMSVDDLSQQAGMSPRNFARVYTQVMGTTPAKAVQTMRVEKARDLLEGSSQSIKQIALASGFIDEDRMRRAFLKELRVTPTGYRQNFQL